MTESSAFDGSSLFQDFTAEEKQIVFQLAEARSVQAGEVVLEMDEPNRSLFVIESGGIAVIRPGIEEDVTVMRLGVGDIFGEMSFVDPSRASARLKADDDTELLALDYEPMYAVLDENPVIAAKLWHNIARELKRRLRQTNELMGHYADLSQVLVENPDYGRYLDDY